MRTIEEQMILAIVNKKNLKNKNTKVSHDENGTEVRLHGNKIAHIKNNSLSISSCGWFTNTTKSRLNAILSHFHKPTIQQKNFNWFINNQQFNDDTEFPV